MAVAHAGTGTGTGEEAEDLLQQTFLQVHRARFDFRSGHRLRPWIAAIALNVKREHLRRRKRRREIPLAGAADSDLIATGGNPESAAQAGLIRRAVQELPANQREVVELHWFAELPFSEVAEIVGARPSAVKVRAHRAYQRLRRRLGSSPSVTTRTTPT